MNSYLCALKLCSLDDNYIYISIYIYVCVCVRSCVRFTISVELFEMDTGVLSGSVRTCDF